MNHIAHAVGWRKRNGSDLSLSPEASHRVSFISGRRIGEVMVDWARVLGTTGEALRGPSDAAIVGTWLEKNDEGAYGAIVAQVSTASTGEIDRLDAALLSIAASSPSVDNRRRLVRFYTVFKIAEMRRYQEFRGFPS